MNLIQKLDVHNRNQDMLEGIDEDSSPLKVGIVGMGKMGRIRLEHVQAHSDMTVKAVCDQNGQTAQTFPEFQFYQDYQHLIEQDLDAVFVCTYNHVAPEITIQAMESGKHVFCEKPPGRSVEDVEQIVAIEEAHPNLKLKYGFNHRYHYAVMETKSMIESGQFGEILWLRGVYGKMGGGHFEEAWRNKENISGGGILLDQGIHMVDLFRYFAGDFDDVRSLVTTSFWDIPVEDNAFAILSNQKGQVALLHSSATQWKHRFTLEICLQGGYININGLLTSSRSYGEESITFAKRQFEDEAFAFGKPREEMIFFDRDDSWELEIDEFAKAIRQDEDILYGGSQDALQVMKLIERIYQQGERA
jgi:predicted dehydrogenase